MISNIANSLGFGSGIDTSQLVQDLAAASRAPKAQRFDALSRANQAKVSALAQARSDLDSFADSLADLSAGGTLRSKPVTSDDTAIAVTANPGTLLGNYAGEIVVSSLARAANKLFRLSDIEHRSNWSGRHDTDGWNNHICRNGGRNQRQPDGSG